MLPGVLIKNITRALQVEVLICSLFLISCAQILPSSSKKQSPLPKTEMTLTMVAFDKLPGWREALVKQSLIAFLKSCKILVKVPSNLPMLETGRKKISDAFGRGYHWQEACQNAQRFIGLTTSGDAKQFFEKNFVPYKISDSNGEEGLITGYFEPYLTGSREPTLEFSEPLYKLPRDLVSVNLGKFKPEWKGQKLIGKINNTEIIPYDERADIERGSLRGKGLELFWVNDSVDVFFLHIQGSGLIIFPDGKKERVGYAGKNGQPYFAIGRDLIARGILTKDQVSLQTIRTWLKTHPFGAKLLMNKNKSYIFFKTIKGPGPIGAQAVPLTPGHSLAVDKRFVPLGAPIWLVTSNPLKPEEPLRRLTVAQDTGSAIRGVVRADLFWGSGNRAELGAGKMKERGRLYIFLPRSATQEDNKYLFK